MKTICLVEDEEDLSAILNVYLEREGWHVIRCATLGEGRAQLTEHVDVWILDLMLPDGNGYELMREVKGGHPGTPVILISARGDSIDRVLGFEMGCDDYIAKPFMPQELVFRVKNVLTQTGNEKPKGNALSYGEYLIDFDSHTVMHGDTPVILTTKEYDLLAFFLTNQREVLSREKIIHDAWGGDFIDSKRSVDNFVKRLRTKLPFLRIETVYGVGYRCVQ